MGQQKGKEGKKNREIKERRGKNIGKLNTSLQINLSYLEFDDLTIGISIQNQTASLRINSPWNNIYF